MDETKLRHFKEDFSLLIEAGFIAVKQLRWKRAQPVFLMRHRR